MTESSAAPLSRHIWLGLSLLATLLGCLLLVPVWWQGLLLALALMGLQVLAVNAAQPPVAEVLAPV